jgi:hypothetical protein
LNALLAATPMILIVRGHIGDVRQRMTPKRKWTISESALARPYAEGAAKCNCLKRHLPTFVDSTGLIWVESNGVSGMLPS